MGAYNHFNPPPLYAIPNRTTFYQPPPSSGHSFQQRLTTPYHSQIVAGLPSHAPVPPQRTVNLATVVPTNNNTNNNTSNYHQPSQCVSPTSMRTQELNIQALQQHIIQQQEHQQTPLSIQTQINMLPTSGYTQ